MTHITQKDIEKNVLNLYWAVGGRVGGQGRGKRLDYPGKHNRGTRPVGPEPDGCEELGQE